MNSKYIFIKPMRKALEDNAVMNSKYIFIKPMRKALEHNVVMNSKLRAFVYSVTIGLASVS